MGVCGSLGHESDFLRVNSGVNLPINIFDGPCKVSGKSGTVGPDAKNIKGNPFGISAKNWRHFRRP